MPQEEFVRSILALLEKLSKNSLNEVMPKRKKYSPRRPCKSIRICGRTLREAEELRQKWSEERELGCSWTDFVARLLAVYKKYQK